MIISSLSLSNWAFVLLNRAMGGKENEIREAKIAPIKESSTDNRKGEKKKDKRGDID